MAGCDLVVAKALYSHPTDKELKELDRPDLDTEADAPETVRVKG